MVNDEEDGSTSNGTIDAESVNVSIEYLATGVDLTVVAQGHQELAARSAVLSGKGLMAESDCSACHQKKVRSIGPSYLEVAQKYKDDAGASDYLVAKIINGGAGVWGDQAMAAHPQLSSADTRKMVSYILSLSDEKVSTVERLGIMGDYHFPSTLDERGSYVLTASYTDKGNENMPSTTAQSTLVLRSPVVEAETFQMLNGVTSWKMNTKDYPALGDETIVVKGRDDGYIGLKAIDLSEIGTLELHMIMETDLCKGGRVEVLIDSPEGSVIAATDVMSPGNRFGIFSQTLKLNETNGIHDLYIMFIGKSSDDIVVLLDKIKFNKAEAIN